MTRTHAHELDAALIVQTIERLRNRIEARFPGSGLGRVCADLIETGHLVARRVKGLNHPFIGMRLLTIALVGLWIAMMGFVGHLIQWNDVLRPNQFVGFAVPLESIVNLTLLIGAAIWTVWNWETRLKRKRVYRMLYQLRSLAHVIDMHQLTKDPSVELGGSGEVTSASPERALSDFQLSRYLDYCTEMLSLIAKLAALYAGQTEDSEIVAAANDVEDLTANLGRKIWQKIMIISNLEKDQSRPA